MYKSLEKYIVYFKESTSFYGSDPKQNKMFQFW